MAFAPTGTLAPSFGGYCSNFFYCSNIFIPLLEPRTMEQEASKVAKNKIYIELKKKKNIMDFFVDFYISYRVIN